MAITRPEMETIININSNDDYVIIYTSDKKVKNCCVRYKYKKYKTDISNGNEVAWHFIAPKDEFMWGKKNK